MTLLEFSVGEKLTLVCQAQNMQKENASIAFEMLFVDQRGSFF